MREGNTGGLPLEEQKMIRADLRGLVKDQRELLSRLADTYTDYLRALGDLDVLQKQLLNQEQQYALFLDERLVWIPSARPVGLATSGTWRSQPVGCCLRLVGPSPARH